MINVYLKNLNQRKQIKIFAGKESSYNDIISFEENRPHASGKARCLQCKHEFVNVSLLGEVYFICPKCNCEKATWIFPFERKGEHWACKCGNMFMLITPECVYCPNCGTQQTGF